MEIKRSGSQASVPGPAEHFTGTVRIDPLYPVGQTLIVTFGSGLHQRWWLEKVTEEQYGARSPAGPT
jgi:hypothetical protein